jgi:hypothetical protein
MSTKVFSSRISLDQYQEILLECDRKGISLSDWLQLQIARSNKLEKDKAEIIRKLNSIKHSTRNYNMPDRVELKIANLMYDIENRL